MFESLRKMFSSVKTDYAQLMSEGAVILDVRSHGEYVSGHIKGSVNIPVNKLSENLNKLKSKNKPIITCCASGMRSASAKGLLESKGFTKVINGGSWQSLAKKIQVFEN
jgi:rhodanese-related sulfurtransferase